MQVQDPLGLLSGESAKMIRKGLEEGVLSGNGLCIMAAGFSLEHAYFEQWPVAIVAAACAYFGKNFASHTLLAKKALEPILRIEADVAPTPGPMESV